MNPFDRMPGPGPRGDRDGFDFLHLIGAFLGIALVLFAVVAIVLLLWNSFRVRAEVRALRGEVARLGSGETAGTAVVGAAGAGAPANPASPSVNAGAFAVPPPRSASAAPAGALAVPPAPPAASSREPKTPTVKTPTVKTPTAKTPTAKTPTAKTPRAPRKKPTDTAE